MHTPCLFEFVYFSRPDSSIDDISVHKSRLRMGDFLGEKILREYPKLKVDVVIPIPDTSRTSAEVLLVSGIGITTSTFSFGYSLRIFSPKKSPIRSLDL